MSSTAHELEQAVAAMSEVREVVQDPAERKVGRALLQSWATDGGGLTENLRRVERMSEAERHELRERAYRACGLETPDERLERENYTPIITKHPPLPTCAVCGTPPLNGAGHPDPNFKRMKRWHCSVHEYLAAPDDLEPPQPTYDPSSMGYDAAEIERMKRQDERIQAAQAVRNEERAIRARELAEVRRVREERFKRELFGAQDFDGFS